MAEFTTGDGVRIHFEAEGREEGPPLIFSNSLGTNLHLWDAQAAEAAGRGFRVIRYDQRGHGGSGAPAGAYTIERLAQDVIEMMGAIGVERAAFCGLSMGGMTGIRLAMHHPRRFTRIALCNTAIWFPAREIWDERIRMAGEGDMAGIADAVIPRWFTAGFREREPETVERVRAMILATDPTGYAGCCAALRDMDMRDRLGLIEAPALVVIGAHDPATTPDQGQYIVSRIPGAQKLVLDTAHLSNIEAEDAFNAHVLGFLEGGHR
jgi:3-oxoadipate enol-lactonase